jgi:exodeoxyribonuclease-3
VKIATYNVNSVRRRLPLVLSWLEKHQPDVLCLQETKVQDTDFPLLDLEAAGYHVAIRGQKSYNGVATLTRKQPQEVIMGLAGGSYDEDRRIIQVVVEGVRIMNTYAPQGYSVPSEKYAYKLAWFAQLRKFFETRLNPADPIIWLGDLNVAPEPIDVYHPDKRINDPDFHIDARNAYKQTRSWGFTDVFRQLHPDRVQYTYWDYFRDAFKNNYGWRIDHILATPALAAQCTTAEVDMEPRVAEGASDHTVMWAEFHRAESHRE